MTEWKHYVRQHLPALRVKPEREAEIVEELAAQAEQAYRDALSSGHDPADADRIAKSQWPDWRKLALEIEAAQPARERPPARFWEGVPADLRHALRLSSRSPVFTAVAVATLALGIGGCTAMFSLLEAVVLRPIGYPDPHQLVMLWENQYRRGVHRNVVAMADYLDWKARNHVFSDMSPILDQVWNVTVHGEPVVLTGISVNERFLPLLGVQPLLGRSFRAEETTAGNPGTVILSHALWVRNFGARADAVGQSITLDDKPRTIIGVLPANFPWLGKSLDTLTPTQMPDRDWRVKAGRFLRVVARRKPGISLAQAQDEMSAIARQLENDYPTFNKEWGVDVVSMSGEFASGAGPALWVLMGAVCLVLLIACSNVANLMLARAVVREREIALRVALGANTFRLVRLLLIESVVLGVTGGTLGSAGAWATIRLVQAFGPHDIGRLETATLNAPVALFAFAASLAAALLFGIAPAVAAGRLNPGAALKEGGRGALNSLRGERLRGAFVVAQVALALVLLTGASLLFESLYRLSAVPPGFDPHNVLTGSFVISGNMENPRLSAMCFEIVDRLRGLPGVENAGFVTFLPFAGMVAATGYRVAGAPPFPPGQTPVTEVRVALPGYFETMKIPLLRGRLFTAADNRPDAPRPFLVSETLARRTFGTDDPLGHSLIVEMGDDKPGQIVGVVGDTRQDSLDGEIKPAVYYIQAQLPIFMGSFVVRTKGRPESLASALTATVRAIKADQPVSDVVSMEHRIGESLARLRFQTALLGAFAFIAVVLAVIGVYGVMAYAVEQRTREIGVRLALGADPARLRRWIALRGMQLAAIGLPLGLLAASLSVRALKSLLYGVKPLDPAGFAIATAALAAACVLASYIPARRATAVDPAIALRGE